MINAVSIHTHIVLHEAIVAEARPVPGNARPAMVTVSIQGVNEVGIPATSVTVTTAQQAEALAAAFASAARTLGLTW